MQRTVLFLIAFITFSFGFSQTINHEVLDDKGKAKLLGKINKDGLKKPAFAEWFNKNYDDYDVNDKVVKKLKDSLNLYTIKVFLGTWCGDSRKEIPRFYSIIDQTNFPEDQLEVFALDNGTENYKQGPNGEEKNMNVHRVPTFIFYKNGKEVNRIVEHPKETLERDILTIVNGERYSPNYMAANYMQYLLTEKGVDSLKQDETNLVPRLAEFVKGSRELNTLGYVYLRAEQFDKALYLFDINTKIFPYKYNVYDSLAEAFYETGDYTEALKNYYKVLSLKPDDKNAPEMIDKIQLKTEAMNKED
ncbi:thioredoxin family protein [Lacinutrix iliipiscaria]|uniref:Thioredoxin family protein n=1 Tax=Lacinutrix iliipiscaria TaxID=1230532 RepID=A0ABW5WLE3_9FLAO